MLCARGFGVCAANFFLHSYDPSRRLCEHHTRMHRLRNDAEMARPLLSSHYMSLQNWASASFRTKKNLSPLRQPVPTCLSHALGDSDIRLGGRILTVYANTENRAHTKLYGGRKP